MQEKSCNNCKHYYNKTCPVPSRLQIDDIETEIQCRLEEGVLDEVLREELDLTELFEYMQEDGYIKKNVKIKEIAQHDTLIDIIVEQISDKLWRHIIRQVKDIDVKVEFENTYDFHCSEWI